MGSSKQTTKQSSTNTSEPLSWQSTDIQSAFQDAMNTYNSQSASPSLNYDTYSPMNSTQTGALDSTVSTSGLQNSVGNSLTTLGSSLAGSNATAATGNLSSAISNASSGAAGNYNTGTTTASDDLIGTAGQNSSTEASALSNALSQSSGDATAQNIADATNYENSSEVQNNINSAINSSDNLYERTTGANTNAQAVAGGNLNSSRAGAYAGQLDALQSANDQSTASSMLQDAYNTGLSLSEQAREANLTGSLNTASTANTGSNLALSAQDSANTLANNNNQTALDYNNQLGSLASSQGSLSSALGSLASTGADMSSTANSNALSAGTTAQTDAETANTDALTAQEDEQQYPWDELSNLYNIIGGTNWGSTSTGTGTSTTTSTASIASMIQGMLGTVAGVAKVL